MRLVARGADQAAGMVGGHHLRKSRGLGGVLFMAARAQNLRVGKRRLYVDEVGRMPGQWAVAGLARDVGVFAGSAGLGLFVVALNTFRLTGEGHGMLADEIQGSGTIVAILAKVLGDHGTPDYQEEG